jgi:glycosyltransferase involved in cell wall biosynthesis
MPKVSIILPVHNGEKKISLALKSLANQTYRDFETVLIDNNCTDKTVEVAMQFEKSANLRVVKCKEPGLVPTLNFGIANSSCDFIARQDDDDYWYPEKLEKQMKFFEENPEVSVLGTQIRLLDPDGRVEELGTFGSAVRYATSDQGIKMALLIGQNPICHPSVIFKRSIILRVGGYVDIWHLTEDLELWCRMIPFAKFANLDEVLLDYTQTIREDYNPNIAVLIADMYYHLYKTMGYVQGERPAVMAEWQYDQMMEMNNVK